MAVNIISFSTVIQIYPMTTIIIIIIYTPFFLFLFLAITRTVEIIAKATVIKINTAKRENATL